MEAYGVVVGGNGALRLVDAAVAVSHLCRPFTTQFTLFGGRLRVSLAILCCRVEVFAQSIKLITFLHSRVRATPYEEYGRYIYI